MPRRALSTLRSEMREGGKLGASMELSEVSVSAVGESPELANTSVLRSDVAPEGRDFEGNTAT